MVTKAGSLKKKKGESKEAQHTSPFSHSCKSEGLQDMSSILNVFRHLINIERVTISSLPFCSGPSLVSRYHVMRS
jgi:BRCT domain type II-containing protein